MDHWPQLSFSEGRETYETIQLWTQIIGKIKLACMPWINHSWHVTLFVTPTGLTTGDIPAQGRHFQISLDFLRHEMELSTSDHRVERFDMLNLPVSECFRKIFTALHGCGIEIKINKVPNELVDPLPFDKDHRATYVPATATALHQAFMLSNAVFTKFRAGFLGKSSPVHFFWGSFDLAVSRFSGRSAPLHPGGIPNLPDRVAQEAYSHEVSSCGFWPGSEALPEAAYYCYIYPEPDGFSSSAVRPDAAYYHKDLREFVLPYDAVRRSRDPENTLMEFLDSTYEAAAGQAGWDRKALEFIPR